VSYTHLISIVISGVFGICCSLGAVLGPSFVLFSQILTFLCPYCTDEETGPVVAVGNSQAGDIWFCLTLESSFICVLVLSRESLQP
jgi:hypothetical protein